MIIKTVSGEIGINKKSHYGKWITGWIDEGGFTGVYTLKEAWERAKNIKPAGCSWYALGRVMANERMYWRKN